MLLGEQIEATAQAEEERTHREDAHPLGRGAHRVPQVTRLAGLQIETIIKVDQVGVAHNAHHRHGEDDAHGQTQHTDHEGDLHRGGRALQFVSTQHCGQIDLGVASGR